MSEKNQKDNPGQNSDNETSALSSETLQLASAINKLAQEVSALKNISVHHKSAPDTLPNGNAFVFEAEDNLFEPVPHVASPPLSLLFGIDRQKQTLFENTRRFAKGYSAHNALLWGARGMGKSTLIKSVHGALAEMAEHTPALIEIQRGDIAYLPKLLRRLHSSERKFIIFCDDLSFDQPDRDFKALKTVLEGGLEGKPANILFYATSNRRHLMPRTTLEQEAATGLHASETMDDIIALSDRFGLWLGFHACDQSDYLDIIAGYASHFGLGDMKNWRKDALNWAKTRGNRSGRTAWQFAQHLAGLKGKNINFHRG